MRKPGLVPSEQVEAEAFAQWLEINRFRFTHIPNETGSSDEAKRRAVRMKRAGTSPGFPDYLIYPPGFNIAIELKSLVGRPSKNSSNGWGSYRGAGMPVPSATELVRLSNSSRKQSGAKKGGIQRP